jgi:hypothetical protein
MKFVEGDNRCDPQARTNADPAGGGIDREGRPHRAHMNTTPSTSPKHLVDAKEPILPISACLISRI